MMLRLNKLAIIGILGSAYLIFITLGIMFGNDPSELNWKDVLAVSIYYLIFSIFVLVSHLKRKKDGTN
jgi:uncharacterized membrane protein